MKVLMLCPHFAEYSLMLAQALARQPGVQVMAIFNEENFRNEIGRDVAIFETGTLALQALPHDRTMRCLFGNAQRYVGAARRFGADIIHCQEEPKDYLLLALLALRRPMVLTVHDPREHSGDSKAPSRYSRRALYKRYLRHRSSGVIVHGETLAAHMREQGYPRQVTVAPHGPLGQVTRIVAPSVDAGRCLFFGRMQAYKGLADFISAIELANLEGAGLHGVIAGRGPDLDALHARVAGQTAFTVIEKYLTPEEVLREFGRAQVVVLPYREATQSGVAAYALGLGRAIVATSVGSLPEVVEEGGNGRLVPPRDPAALARALRSIVDDPKLARAMGARSLELGRERLSWTVAAQNALRMFRAVLQQKPA